jgi:hypothetical protein
VTDGSGAGIGVPRQCSAESEGFFMLDMAGILFSSLMMLMIIVRAVRLDRLQPWFQVIERKKPLGNVTRTWRRGS